jgi:hypothetical protein
MRLHTLGDLWEGLQMRAGPVRWSKALVPLLIVLAFPHGVGAQQDKVAALKQSLAANQQLQKQYKWVETTVVSMKGEEKSRTQKQCFYGPDGKVQKQQLTAPPQQSAPGGVKGKAVAKKQEEITAAMNQAVALVHTYVPPDPQRIQAAKAAGNLSVTPTGPNSARMDLRNYVKSGDTLSLGLDTAGNAIQTARVKSYLGAPSDAVTLDVTFARLREGLSYPGNVVLNVPGQQVQVVVQNSNYQKVAAAGPAPAQTKAAPAGAPASGGASTAAMDALTAPIALYPDALIAQILQASTDVPTLQKFSAWLGSNASLKGTPLQDAAQAAGFAACYIALAPFGQVVQMLVQKPDWTAQLGRAFVADKAAVFDSIQRLRAAAQALGNLKTTEQQEVVTETTSTGQSVIVIQPANPQVVYVPVYNSQTVYVQAAPPPSSASVAGAAVVGFTAGIIIGAASDHYYHGPYGWHGAAMYEEAWDRREDYWDDRQDFAEDRYDNRQDYAQDRQSNAQANQQQRQSTAQSNQSQRQSSAQANQANRQTAASSGTAQANQATRQASAATSSAGSGQAAAARSSGGGGLSGYQSGGSARAQGARGSSSRSASRGGGGGGRRR